MWTCLLFLKKKFFINILQRLQCQLFYLHADVNTWQFTQGLSSLPAPHYSVPLQLWGDAHLEREGINKHIHCGTHCLFHTRSRKQLSPWILMCALLPVLITPQPLCCCLGNSWCRPAWDCKCNKSLASKVRMLQDFACEHWVQIIMYYYVICLSRQNETCFGVWLFSPSPVALSFAPRLTGSFKFTATNKPTVHNPEITQSQPRVSLLS